MPSSRSAASRVGRAGDLDGSAAVYFLEVVSARSTGGQRARSDTTLGALRALRADQLAGGAGPDDSLGHPLPFPVDDAADAARLARAGADHACAPATASTSGRSWRPTAAPGSRP